jgi:cephalosporin hydroxylase
MNENALRDFMDPVFSALQKSDAGPLINVMSDDVDYFVDWKGEGVFEGGQHHGRKHYSGKKEATGFFKGLFDTQKIKAWTPQHYISNDYESYIIGRVEWAMTGDDKAYASDWVLRLVFAGDKAQKVRLLTLPDGHIDTFIPNHAEDFYLTTENIDKIVNDFQRLYFDAYLLGKTWSEAYWNGIPIFKNPADLWVYQELIYDLKPDFIIETGTCAGGSAHYLASMCELFGKGQVITIDLIKHLKGQPAHDRLTYLVGSSTSQAIDDQLKTMIPEGSTVMVVLDSDHRGPHVLDELRLYAKFVTPGSYMIVEDSYLNGRPAKPNFGPGPAEAIEQFLEETDEFYVDREKEKFLSTFNPGGYLRKKG